MRVTEVRIAVSDKIDVIFVKNAYNEWELHSTYGDDKVTVDQFKRAFVQLELIDAEENVDEEI